MEVFVERLLIELLAIALQIALVRFYRWLRSRAGSGVEQSEVLLAA